MRTITFWYQYIHTYKEKHSYKLANYLFRIYWDFMKVEMNILDWMNFHKHHKFCIVKMKKNKQRYKIFSEQGKHLF